MSLTQADQFLLADLNRLEQSCCTASCGLQMSSPWLSPVSLALCQQHFTTTSHHRISYNVQCSHASCESQIHFGTRKLLVCRWSSLLKVLVGPLQKCVEALRAACNIVQMGVHGRYIQMLHKIYKADMSWCAKEPEGSARWASRNLLINAVQKSALLLVLLQMWQAICPARNDAEVLPVLTLRLNY